MENDEDFIDGCEEDFAAEAVTDDDLDGIVLFGDPESVEDIEATKAAWEELFDA